MRLNRLGALVVVSLLGLVGCGGGGTSTSAPSAESAEATTALRGPKPAKDASPLERQVYRNFQPPIPDPEVSGSAAAIEAGEAACRGKTPVQVKSEFLPESDLSAAQRQALAQIDRAEAHPGGDFAAGQLAALVYQQTLEGTAAEYGYRGCVYALARGLESSLGR
jgi:hypothetical protein